MNTPTNTPMDKQGAVVRISVEVLNEKGWTIGKYLKHVSAANLKHSKDLVHLDNVVSSMLAEIQKELKGE